MTDFKKEPLAAVGILSEKKISFELYGDYKIAGFKQLFSGRFSAAISNDRIICKGSKDKLEISSEIVFEPEDPSMDFFLIKEVPIGLKFHWERKENQKFLGSLKLFRDNDKIWIINIIPLEKYLTSVISSEMSAKSSIELLKAHSIVSRNWFLAQLQKSKSKKDKYKQSITEEEIIKWHDRGDHKFFDVCADDHCQRYQGITKISSDSAIKAVEETKGLVLLSDDKLCDTRYSKSCGGITEGFEAAWEPVKYKYLQPVFDYKYEPENYSTDFSSEESARKWILSNPPAFCSTKDPKILSQVLQDYDQQTTDFYRWRVEYSKAELSKLINTKTGLDFGEITDLVPVQRGASARLVKLKVAGTKKTVTIGKELEIRRILSPTHLYSSAIIIDKLIEDDTVKFVIHGAGWGHGVGLCQIGAAVMAFQGYQFDEILLHYFSNARLKRIY